MVHIFARTIDTAKRREFAVNPLQILALDDCDETDGYDDTGNYDEPDDCGRILARPQFNVAEGQLAFTVETNKATYLAANGEMPERLEPATALLIEP